MNIRSTPEKVFRRWATAAGMESFFIKEMKLRDATGKHRAANEEMEAGDRFDWEWYHGGRSYGRVLAVESEKLVSFTFNESEVTVRFVAHDGSWLHIRRSRIPEFPAARAGLHVGCRSGWTYFSTVLKALEENGIDIRDKNPQTAGSLSTNFVVLAAQWEESA